MSESRSALVGIVVLSGAMFLTISARAGNNFTNTGNTYLFTAGNFSAVAGSSLPPISSFSGSFSIAAPGPLGTNLNAAPVSSSILNGAPYGSSYLNQSGISIQQLQLFSSSYMFPAFGPTPNYVLAINNSQTASPTVASFLYGNNTNLYHAGTANAVDVNIGFGGYNIAGANPLNGNPYISSNGGLTVFDMTLTTHFGTVSQAAASLGYTGFDFVSTITLPAAANPLPLYNPLGSMLFGPNNVPYVNSPLGTPYNDTLEEYAYNIGANGPNPQMVGLYFNPLPSAVNSQLPSEAGSSLTFTDQPADFCNYGAGLTQCATPLEFTTSLVGYNIAGNSVVIGNPLFSVQWTSNYEPKASGGISVISGSDDSPSGDGGIGGINVISVNGVLVASVPESSSWILLVCGFGFIVLLSRRPCATRRYSRLLSRT